VQRNCSIRSLKETSQ